MALGRFVLASGLLLLGVSGLLGAGVVGAAPAAADAQHGKYVFQLATCAGCHGSDLAGWRPNNQTPPSGGHPGELFEGPFGRIPAPNVSQDKDTGIGGWTDQQILDAVQNGRSAHGEQLFPIMPYTTFHFMSDQDAADLVAFLRTTPAVKNEVPERQLNGPVPPIPPLPPGPATAPTGNGVERGRYLVSSTVLCNDCHTPMNPDGSPDMSRMLAGGAVPREGGTFQIAPNITPDQNTGIGRWTTNDIITLLHTGNRPQGRAPVQGLMREVIENPPWGGYNQMTDADAQAIAAYLKSIPAVNNVARAPGAPAAAPSGGPAPSTGAAPPTVAQPAPTPRPTTAPVQAPGQLPRTGLGADLATPIGALGGLLVVAGAWMLRRRR